MAFLSKRLMGEVMRASLGRFGMRPRFVDLSGESLQQPDPLAALANTRRRRDYALQQSVNIGAPFVYRAAPTVATWVLALEDRRMIHGAMVGAEVRLAARADGQGNGTPDREEPGGDDLAYLASHGMPRGEAKNFLAGLPLWSEARAAEAAGFLHRTFYDVSGWKPVLMEENRLKALQQAQISQAIDDQRRHGRGALYAFEKERMLLANIRAGDRNEARRILNEMLAAIYMSSPQLVVLRARAVELMSCLTRAAIEDNPLLEPLIEQNHAWTELLVHAEDFEDLSHKLMRALDEFIDGIYLHGVNRSNTTVRRALDFIRAHYGEPISLRHVAGAVGISPWRLSHVVRQFTGRTVLQILHEVRVRHAQELLDRTERSGAEIAYEVGFGDQSYFIRQFRRLTGTTPARYRRARGPRP